MSDNPTALSHTETGVLLFIVASDIMNQNNPSFGKRGESYSVIIGHLSAAHIDQEYLTPKLELADDSSNRIANPYRGDAGQLKEAITRLVEDGYLTAYKNSLGTRLIPNASAVQALIEAGGIGSGRTDIQDYIAKIETEKRNDLQPVSPGEFGHFIRRDLKKPNAPAPLPTEKPPVTVSWSALQRVIGDELGLKSPHAVRILERLQATHIPENSR